MIKLTDILHDILRESTNGLDAKLKNIKKIVGHSDAYCILDSDKNLGGSTWNSGGCYLLARALHQVLPNSDIVALYDYDDVMQHVLVYYNGMFYDADGASTERELLKRWEEEEYIDDPYIDYSFNEADLGEIGKPHKRTVDKMVNYLSGKLK